MDKPNELLFSNRLMQRFEASVAAPRRDREQIARRVMEASGLPREGTSGPANAYLIFVSDEFGKADPPWSPDEIDQQGWDDLWRLRIGSRNPHFLTERELFRKRRPLWRNLYAWLPKAFGDAEVGYTMCAWANLAEGHATHGSLTRGMNKHVAPFIRESAARVVVASKKEAWHELERWAAGGASSVRVDDMEARRVAVDSQVVLAAYVGGHPSHANQQMSSADFVRRVGALVSAAEALAG